LERSRKPWNINGDGISVWHASQVKNFPLTIPRFTLGYRDVEDVLAERGLDISYEAVRRWFLKYGTPIAANLRNSRPTPSDHWHLDEMVIMIRGKRHWLWRAVDNEGEVLDFLVQTKRNANAALKLMRKLLKKQGYAPTRIVTDKLRSYHVAFKMVGLSAEHVDNKRTNNRAENSLQPVRRRERKMQKFKSPGSAQRFLNVQSATYNTFYFQRHLINLTILKQDRAVAFREWECASAV
jgi:putative transposase